MAGSFVGRGDRRQLVWLRSLGTIRSRTGVATGTGSDADGGAGGGGGNGAWTGAGV